MIAFHRKLSILSHISSSPSRQPLCGVAELTKVCGYIYAGKVLHILTLHLDNPNIENSKIIPSRSLSSSQASQMASSPFTLPADFLSSPGPEKVVRTVDFKEVGLPEYDGLFAVVIDNCLTKEECNKIVRAAEATSKGKLWEQALVNVGNGRQKLMTDVRDCGRIIWDDRVVVAKIWSRVKDCVLPDIEYVKNKPKVTGFGPVRRGEVLQLTRPNERMRFLRYEPGQYFRRLYLFSFFSLNEEHVYKITFLPLLPHPPGLLGPLLE